MDPKVRDWVWHHPPAHHDPNLSRFPALVIATEGPRPKSRSANTVYLMFDNGFMDWLSLDWISPCSREQAISARRQAKTEDPERNSVEEIEGNADRWRERHSEQGYK